MLVLAVRSRPQLWEAVAIAGLGVAAVRASRKEVWLALLIALPAARGLAGSRPWSVTVPRSWRGVTAWLLVLLALSRTRPYPRRRPGATPRNSCGPLARAGGTAILADGFDAEQLAVAGNRILIGNPLDAFPPHEQRRYLDWLAGRPAGDVELARVRVALVGVGSAAQRRLAARREFRELARGGPRAVLYVRSNRHASVTDA